MFFVFVLYNRLIWLFYYVLSFNFQCMKYEVIFNMYHTSVKWSLDRKPRLGTFWMWLFYSRFCSMRNCIYLDETFSWGVTKSVFLLQFPGVNVRRNIWVLIFGRPILFFFFCTPLRLSWEKTQRRREIMMNWYID